VSEQTPPVDDLFGDDDPQLVEPETPLGKPQRQFPTALGVALGAIIALALFWYASSVQHDRYFLIVEGDSVHVERGYFFPFGSGAFSESRAYEPFQLSVGVKAKKTGSMSVKDLDKELLRIYMEISKKEITDLAVGRPDVAEDMLWRAQKLRSTSVMDDRRLLKLLGDVAFRRGLKEVKGIQSRFDQALEQFTLAAMRGGESYKGADKWVTSITSLRREFRRLAVESGLDPDQILEERVAPKVAPPPKGDETKAEPPTPPPADEEAAADAGAEGK